MRQYRTQRKYTEDRKYVDDKEDRSKHSTGEIGTNIERMHFRCNG
jgi:hypothetical protein